jgi:hypothetical protein
VADAPRGYVLYTRSKRLANVECLVARIWTIQAANISTGKGPVSSGRRITVLSYDPVQSQEIWMMILADKSQAAEIHRLARQAKPWRHMVVRGQFRWLLCSLGYALVALGARLEAYAMAPLQSPRIGNNGAGSPGYPCGSAC